MQREPNVNGGTKLLTASVVMTLGVGGALLFRQEPSDPPRPDAATAESLVRRSLGRAAGSNDPSVFVGGSLGREPLGLARGDAGWPASAQLTGAIDPFRNPGTQADAERRLTSDYGRGPSASAQQPAIESNGGLVGGGPAGASPFPPSRYFVDPKSDAERTPMNNVTSNIRLPAEYPAAGGTSDRSFGAAANSAANASSASSESQPSGALVPLGSLGSPAGGGASIAGERSRSSFVNSAGDLGASSTGSGFATGGLATGGLAAGGFGEGRAVMPTLRANSGGDPFAGASASVGGAAGSTTMPTGAPATPGSSDRELGSQQYQASGRVRRHRVRDGDTLTGLSQKYYGDAERYIAIYEANRAVLPNPDLLTIGTDLVIPSSEDAAAMTASAPAAATPPAARIVPRVQIRSFGE
jgi:nucleoid-associated protein YgaU